MGWILPVIALAAEAGGTAVSAFGQVGAGAAAKQAGELNAQDILSTALANAQEAEYQAANVLEATQLSEKQYRYQAGQVISKGRAIQGASGILSNQGSSLDVLAENTRQSELQALEIRRSGTIQAETIRRQQQADLERASREAQVARAGGNAVATRADYGAGATILGGGAKIGENALSLANTASASSYNNTKTLQNKGYLGQ